MMVELGTRNREMRGVGRFHHKELEHKSILSATQFTIPDVAGTGTDVACNNTYAWSSLSNQASSTPDFSHLLLSST
jgi:hypothetical protein